MPRMWCVALVLFACGKNNDSGNAQDPRVAGKAKIQTAMQAPERRGPAFALAPQPIDTAPAAPGPAHLFISNVGLVTIAIDGTISTTKIPFELVGCMGVNGQGRPLIASKHVYQLGAAGPEQLGGDESPEEQFACTFRTAPDGKVWLASTSAIHSWDGAKWTKFAKPLGEEPVMDLAIDGKGRVYAAGPASVWVFDGAWKNVYDIRGVPEEGFIKPPYFRQLFISGNDIVAMHSDGFVRLDGKGVTFVDRKPTDPALGHGLAVGDDYVGVSDRNKFNTIHVIRTPMRGGADKINELPLGNIKLNKWAIDAGGRAWATSETQFAILPTEGAPITWPVGSIPEINGSISAIAIVGSGPQKLPTAGAIAKGTVKGTVTNKAAPIASAYVEVCTMARDTFEKDTTPCAGRPVHGKADTDETGVFTISDLPLQDYQVVIRAGDKWYKLIGAQCAGMKAGDTCDLGMLDVTNNPFEY